MQIVELPKKVTGENLEQACIKAAGELGYKTKVKDEFTKTYRLGSLHERDDYAGTHIVIKGLLFSALQVHGIKKGSEQDRFYVFTGFPFGFAPKERVEGYLSLISKY